MITSAVAIIRTLAATRSQTKNPVKLRIILICLSITLFFMMSLKTGQVWFPTLIFLIFIGGILMIFMILSSVLPNEKPGKTKIKVIIRLILVLWMIRNSRTLIVSETHEGVKGILRLSLMLVVIFTLISIYFLTVIMIAKRTESPLRLPVSCQKND